MPLSEKEEQTLMTAMAVSDLENVAEYLVEMHEVDREILKPHRSEITEIISKLLEKLELMQ